MWHAGVSGGRKLPAVISISHVCNVCVCVHQHGRRLVGRVALTKPHSRARNEFETSRKRAKTWASELYFRGRAKQHQLAGHWTWAQDGVDRLSRRRGPGPAPHRSFSRRCRLTREEFETHAVHSWASHGAPGGSDGCCTTYPSRLVWSPVLPGWESRQLVKRTAHFDAHLRVSSTPRCGSATASGTGAYSDFLAGDAMAAQEQRARAREIASMVDCEECCVYGHASARGPSRLLEAGHRLVQQVVEH